jgi:hypothetical protein
MDPVLLTVVVVLATLGILLLSAGLASALAYWWLSRQAAGQSALKSLGNRPRDLILNRVGIGVCLAMLGAVGCATQPQTTKVTFLYVGSQLTAS